MVFNALPDESKGNWKAEFSMGQYDYQRYHEHLTMADNLNMAVINHNVDAIRPFYSIIKTLWVNWKSIVNAVLQEKINRKMKEADILFRNWKAMNHTNNRIFFPEKLADILIDVYSDLLVVKQYIGLGMLISKDESEKTRMKRAMGLIH